MATMAISRAKPLQSRRGLRVNSPIHFLQDQYRFREVDANILVFQDCQGPVGNNELFGPLRQEEAVSLGQIDEMLLGQPRGEDGDLLTDGRMNLFLILDQDGSLHIIFTFWDVVEQVWQLHCVSWNPSQFWERSFRVFKNSTVV